MNFWLNAGQIGRKALVLSVFSVVFSLGFHSLKAQNNSYITPSNYAWLSSGGTIKGGSYTGIGWAGTLTIPAGETVSLTNPNFSSGKLIVEGKLIVNGNDFNANGPVIVNGELEVVNSLNINIGYLTVNSGAAVRAKNLYLANPNNVISGTVIISQNTTIASPPTTFSNCGALYTTNFNNASAPNPITGNGFISISGTYTGSNSLTQSPGITVAYAGSNGNLGAAVRSMSNPCSSLPIKYVKGSFRLIKKSSKL